LDESAKELSLPIDIVKEFIKDFIEQCHADTDKIIHKYEECDIEKIKKLAHTLKGISSNLYIMPLADTLLELQNNDDLTQVKPLVEKYWGQFLYLENLMKNI
ncbi:MAG: Hpt domain-containing protein, partial [Epsilonproteobacteria bacterium]|nr:Hpt domain-containing protein [Campylobacterota bacterium]